MKVIDADKVRAWVEENACKKCKYYLKCGGKDFATYGNTCLDMMLLSFLSAEEQEGEIIKGYCKDCHWFIREDEPCDEHDMDLGLDGYCSDFEPREVSK